MIGTSSRWYAYKPFLFVSPALIPGLFAKEWLFFYYFLPSLCFYFTLKIKKKLLCPKISQSTCLHYFLMSFSFKWWLKRVEIILFYIVWIYLIYNWLKTISIFTFTHKMSTIISSATANLLVMYRSMHHSYAQCTNAFAFAYPMQTGTFLNGRTCFE